MKELQDIIREFERRPGEVFALATLVRARGSSYRRPGARMLICEKGDHVGLLSGGCLEDEVAQAAREVMQTGTPKLLEFDTRRRFGCHGAIEVLVERVRAGLIENISDHLRARRAFFIATVFERQAVERCSTVVAGDLATPTAAFVQQIQPPLQLLICGSGPDSAPLRDFAEVLGWRVIEIENASMLAPAYDPWTAVVVKSHNYGRDFAALRHLLPLDLRYVGLVGPRRRRDELLGDILDSGVTIRSQLFSPAGLDLGAETPEEIALAIVAEIQNVFTGGTAESLRDRRAAIHRWNENGASITPATSGSCRRMGILGAVILAAGGSSRFGQPKQLLTFEGESLVRRAVATARGGGCGQIAVVVGEDRGLIEDELRGTSARIVDNPEWRRGLGTSIRAGLCELLGVESELDAVILLACDQPFVDAAAINALVAERAKSGKPIVASAYANTVGIPALFDRSCFDALLALADDSGAKGLIESRPSEVASVAFDRAAIDLDTREDYRRLINTR